MRIIFWLFISIGMFSPIWGQSLIGTLTDAHTQTGISNARIELLGQNRWAYTDSSGQYRMEGLTAGNWLLRVSRMGYSFQTLSITLKKDQLTQQDMILSPLPYQLHQAVVITAQRQTQDPLNRPEHFSILSQTQLRENAPRSTPEALMGLTGVWVQKTNHGGGSPFVRGLTGNQTLLLVDGIRLNNSTYRYGPNQYLSTVDPWMLAQAEVLRGSGAVQYGSDALGGSINLQTKEPEFQEEGLSWHSAGFFKGMTQGMELTGRLETGYSSKRSALLLGVNNKEFGDLLAGGDSVLAPSAYTERNVDFKFRQLIGQRNELTLALQHTDQRNVGRYDQVAQRGYAYWEFDPQQRSLTYLRWKHYSDSRWAQEIRITPSLQRSLEGRRSLKVGSTAERRATDEIRTAGLTVEVESAPSANWHIVSGIDAYYDLVNSEASTFDTLSQVETFSRGLYPDGATAAQGALFSLHRWRVNSLLDIHGGARLQWIGLQTSDETFGDQQLGVAALVGNLGLVAHVSEQQRLTAGLNTGFRAPNINDVSSFGSFDFGIEVPTDDLAPERSLTAELGYKARFSNLSVSIVGYHTWLFNLITRVPGTYLGDSTYQGEAVYRKANLDRARILGAEGDIEWRIGSVQVYSGIAYAYGADADGGALRRIPPLNGRMGVRYSAGGFWVKAEGMAATLQDRLSGGDISDHRIPEGGTPGWQVINLGAGYTWKWVRFTLGVQNLFDQRYRLHGSGVDAYGRSAWGVLQVSI